MNSMVTAGHPRRLIVWGLGLLLAASPTIARAQEKTTAPLQDRSGTAVASETKPVAVVSIASLDELLRDVSYLSSSAGQPQAGAMLGGLAGGFTNGLDRSRPIGLIVSMVDNAPSPVLLVPVKDLKTFLKTFEAQIGPPDELEDGTLAIAAGPQLLYIREQGGWAFAAQSRESLADLPPDPAAMLTGLDKKYLLGIRLNVQAIPEGLRQLAVDQLMQGFEQAAAQQTDPDQKQMMEMSRAQLDQLATMINELDELVIGWDVDSNKRHTILEFTSTAVAGSSLADQMAAKVIPSNFAGFLQSDAAAYGHFSTSIPESAIANSRGQIEQAVAQINVQIEKNVPQESREQVKELLKEFIKQVQATVEEGVQNAGFVVRTDNNQLQAVGGGRVADGRALEKMVKKIADQIRNEPQAPRFKFDVENFKEVTLHEAEIDLPADAAEGRKMFGPALKLAVGTGDKVIYLAAGGDPMAMLKKSIEANQLSANLADTPQTVNVRLLPLLSYAQWVKPNPVLDQMVASLQKNPEIDQVRIDSELINLGQTIRITIQEGLLQAAGAAAMAGQEPPAGP
jgi:hypothetical protein